MEDGRERRIGKVVSAFLGYEDHGLLTMSVTYDYGSASQCLGNFAFGRRDGYDASAREDEWQRGWLVSNAYGMRFLQRLLDAHGVESWSGLVGRTVFVTATHTAILAIEPLPTERGQELDVEAFVREWRAAK